ncbi:MULE transposase [Hirsutella rhossiliensis]|uniref:MULE transposase domain-containing protein n=1 Tax=Hirsutella rhossiliensis TaxID=111463 RepID=A0A9P8MIU8_9HYPO|nr:MULE transposase domain-containing protein [Hirsutella rhossiliensis]KAH0957163.1 MULE transposase domain-containing protein [Hirsutella rhossiliensis]
MRYTISSRHGQKATSLACQDHTARGVDEPWWKLRQSQIFLDDSFRGGGARRLFTTGIPDADKLERQRLRCLLRVEEVDARKQVVARFQPALTLAWELAETDSLLARELAKCREASGPRQAIWERGDDCHGRIASPTPLVSSLSQDGQEYEEWNGFSDAECGDYSDVEPIPNPQIPGTAAPSIEALHAEPPGTVYMRRDIYNARALLRRENLGGMSPTAALIKLFDERGIPYIAKWSETEPDRLVGLVWTFPYCIRMWKRFPEVISFDNTYNTNRFKLPLFQATGQTCLKSVYNAAFGLIDNERREGFQFLAEGIRQLFERHGIQLPNVVITDFDQQMKAALEDQFPDAQQQLCIFHINSNVLLNAKRKWKHAKEDSDEATRRSFCIFWGFSIVKVFSSC